MNISKIENKVVDVLHNDGKIDLKDIVLKYNGVELNITTQRFPILLNFFVKKIFQSTVFFKFTIQTYKPKVYGHY